MKKLKIKVFATISIILSIFIFILVLTTITRNYLEQKSAILDILNKISIPLSAHNKPEENFLEDTPAKPPREKIMDNKDSNTRRIYLDRNVYTIVLDEKGNYKELINHTENDTIEEEKIQKAAQEIIDSHTQKIHIGNLYIEKYAYAFTNNETLLLIDNTNINNVLCKSLILNIFLFILLEVIVLLLTFFLTKWIITPVRISFENQKRFIADASHELKTPLAVMIASADAYFNDKNEKWIKNMKNESERMIKLVTELLDLSAAEKIKDLPKKEEDLSNIIESSILTYESMFYENKLRLQYKIEANIKYVCNEDYIRQLIVILMDNAIKHSVENGKVEIYLYKNNKTILFEIKNNGIPIKKEEEEKIFERFYKADTARNRNNNTYGLGLAIAKNIVELHKGSITAHSEKDVTTFKVIWNQK